MKREGLNPQQGKSFRHINQTVEATSNYTNKSTDEYWKFFANMVHAKSIYP